MPLLPSIPQMLKTTSMFYSCTRHKRVPFLPARTPSLAHRFTRAPLHSRTPSLAHPFTRAPLHSPPLSSHAHALARACLNSHLTRKHAPLLVHTPDSHALHLHENCIYDVDRYRALPMTCDMKGEGSLTHTPAHKKRRELLSAKIAHRGEIRRPRRV